MLYLTKRKNRPSYDIQPGNGVGLFWDTTHTPRTHTGGIVQDIVEYLYANKVEWNNPVNEIIIVVSPCKFTRAIAPRIISLVLNVFNCSVIQSCNPSQLM